MYLNFFARKWCTDSFKTLFSEISKDYEIYAINAKHEKIHNPTFHERCITHVIVESGNDWMSFAINGIMKYSDYITFDDLYYDFKKSNPITKKDVPLQQNMKSDVETTLGIDNNVNQEKDKKITFCLNDYTSMEREKIIAFLVNIDGKSPEVYIDIDLSSCNKEQADHLSNILLCASSLTNT